MNGDKSSVGHRQLLCEHQSRPTHPFHDSASSSTAGRSALQPGEEDSPAFPGRSALLCCPRTVNWPQQRQGKRRKPLLRLYSGSTAALQQLCGSTTGKKKTYQPSLEDWPFSVVLEQWIGLNNDKGSEEAFWRVVLPNCPRIGWELVSFRYQQKEEK